MGEASQDEVKAFKLFMADGAWNRGNNTWVRTPTNARIEILKHTEENLQPIVTMSADQMAKHLNGCGSLKEAKETAWKYYKGRTLLDTLTDRNDPPAENTDPT